MVALTDYPDCTEEEVVASLCKSSFKYFVKEFWDTVPGAAPLQWNWHMDVLCLPPESVITTEEGGKTIKEIVDSKWNGKVLSYNHVTGEVEWKKIVKWMKSPGKTLVEICTEESSKVSVTENHPIYVVGRGYIRADEVRQGEEVLCVSLLQESVSLPYVPLNETEDLLQCSVLQQRQRRKKKDKRFCTMQRLWRKKRSSISSLSKLLEKICQKKSRRDKDSLLLVQSKTISNSFKLGNVSQNFWGFLWQRVFQSVRSWGKQSSLYQRKRLQENQILPRILETSEEDNKERRTSLFSLWKYKERKQRKGNRCSPYKLGCKQKSELESSDVVSFLSQQTKRRYGTRPKVFKSVVSSVIRKIRIPETVYNIEVEGNHNYFADGFLVHNCDEMELVARRVFKNQRKEYDLIINISPGTSKSSICSILFHPWTWTIMPTARHLNASHTAELVLDLAYKAREVLRSEKYRACFPYIELKDDKSGQGLYRNTAGGDRMACTVGGKSPMGFHAHFLTVDDPIDPKKAVSEVELRSAKEFVSNILPTRKVHKAVSVTTLIMQRLHRQDPTAVMLENAEKGGGSVKHLCLPASLEYKVIPKELESKYVDNLMDPVRMPQEVLNFARITLGEYGYSGQFGQNPTPAKGGMFKTQYFNQRVKAAPYHAKRIRYFDRAATDQGGCYTAGTLISMDSDGNFYIEDCVHGQWEPDERNKVMRATALKDRIRYGPKNEPVIWVEAEGGSSGRDAWKGVAKALKGFVVHEDKVTGDKDTRAEPWASQCAALNVYIVDNGESKGQGKATWDVQGYIEEHVSFKPEVGKRGRYKDRVDSSSGGFNLLAGSRHSGDLIRIYKINEKRKGLQIIPCSREELANFSTDRPTLLISLCDPNLDEIYAHGIDRLQEAITLKFCDIQPEEYQDCWDDPIAPFDEPPANLIMTRDHGKSIWSTILKKRDPASTAIVIQDDGDRRAFSVALAICDTLALSRNHIYRPGNPEEEVKKEDKAPNIHIYNVVKASRGAVV